MKMDHLEFACGGLLEPKPWYLAANSVSADRSVEDYALTVSHTEIIVAKANKVVYRLCK